MKQEEMWLSWAVELQSLAQAGLFYGKDVFDRERYTRIREISAEMLAHMSDIPLETVMGLFCNEIGYQTPKIDTRAAIFREGKILLVKERDGRWSLPGGWCDVDASVAENTVKEVKEEAGLDVVPEKVIAVQDRARHNQPRYAYGICKIFVQCRCIGGEFAENSETTEARYFDMEELPELAGEKNTTDQIRMCFAAYGNENWKTLLD
jgi:ADP-ribose pyrophosphatase YjhB (NUDIX family)